jgi:hypothetical protein
LANRLKDLNAAGNNNAKPVDEKIAQKESASLSEDASKPGPGGLIV